MLHTNMKLTKATGKTANTVSNSIFSQSCALFLPLGSHIQLTQVELIVCFSMFMLCIAWKRGLPQKFACFALFHPIKKRSFHLLCVLHRQLSRLCRLCYQTCWKMTKSFPSLSLFRATVGPVTLQPGAGPVLGLAWAGAFTSALWSRLESEVWRHNRPERAICRLYFQIIAVFQTKDDVQWNPSHA